MTIEGLFQENKNLKEENAALRYELDQLKRAIYGSKRERFIPQEPDEQISIFDQGPEGEQSGTTDSVNETTSSSSTLVKKRVKKKIARNTFPVHLEREEKIIEPQNHEDGFKKIGKDVTEILKYTPMSLKVLRIVRPRYVNPAAQEKNIHQANIPARIIPKGLVDDSVIAGLISEKFEYHMPVYRFVKKIRKAGIHFIKAKHCYNYIAKVGEMMQPLHELMLKEMLGSGYIQMDESSIRVLSQDKENGKLRGCMWVMHAPRSDLVVFNYRAGKEKEYAYELLDGYHGVLQTDGNVTYQGIADAPSGSKLMGRYQIEVSSFLNCWAHTRRKFYEARDLEPDLIDPILKLIQQLYDIERTSREEQMDSTQRQQWRQDNAAPILASLKVKLDQVTEKNITGPVKKAFTYTIKRWSQLSNYINNGDWEIDTNALENKIRLLALGRKNYLFAKNDQTAQHVATFYSLIASCHMNNIDVFQYICWLFHKMVTEKIDDQAINWLPHKIDPKAFE